MSTRSAIGIVVLLAAVGLISTAYEKGELPYFNAQSGACAIGQSKHDMMAMFSGPGGEHYCDKLLADEYDLEKITSQKWSDGKLDPTLLIAKTAQSLKSVSKDYELVCHLHYGELHLFVFDTGGQIFGESFCRRYFDKRWERA